MKKAVLLAVLVISTSVSAGPSNHTITGGYARTNASDTHLDGFNIKYGYQFDDSAWGIIGSLTATAKEDSFSDDAGYKTEVDAGYASLMAGPSYNITDDIKIYALVGTSGADVKLKYNGNTEAEYKAHSPVVGVGFQYAIWKGFTVDASYEYAKFKHAESDNYYVDSFNAKTLAVGIGYKF